MENRKESARRIAYRFRQNPLSLVGLGIIVGLVFIAIFAPYIARHPQDAGYMGEPAVDFANRFAEPSLAHPFGTDQAGRDILSRVIFGTRYSLALGLFVLTFAIGIGVPVGLVAGYVGGFTGQVLMRITDIFLSVPPLVLALAVAVPLQPSLRNAMIAIAVVWWPWYARLVYGEVISVREEQFVEASRGIGASRIRIMFREILPNVLAPITVKFSLDMGYAILIGASLGFLGLGAQPPTPEWGTMIAEGRAYLPAQWWYSTFPGVAIFIAVLGFNLLGDGLRDVLDVEVD
ncbi:ABC transporter permease subunit [Natronorubrum sp. JWXQ-INN-674]|uniref:ABC transporter permease subunit n=2 Tax=Natronorubrum halalkaliphilum TaxID=2691917 RepID=A0A6B0VQE7_9EURY|nr:ABC transporter permease subunit [Natronorubrum halalkaliphilum]